MITIHVSPEQGIVLTGAGPDHHNLLGDRDHGGLGLTWSEHDGRKGAWYEPHSRHKPLAQHRARIAEIAATLRAAGSPVTIDVSGTASRPTRKAKTGHRPYWVTRTRIAEHLQQHRRDPRATLRRIQRLQEQLRRIDRALNGQAYPQPVEHDGKPVLAEDGRALLQWHPATGDHRDRLQHDQARLQARIAYWQDIVAQAAEQGVKVWGPQDFQPGDFVLHLGTWYEVLRVNAKSLTVPTGHIEVGRPILRRADTTDLAGQPSHATVRLPYSEMHDRMSQAEAANRFPA